MPERIKNPFAAWLENFDQECEFLEIGNFIRAVEERYEKMEENLPPELMRIRKGIREKFGIPTDKPVVFYGEQSVGLSETGVVAGKRLVAAMLPFSKVNYRAQSDVAGSEPGLNSIILPNPYKPEGVAKVRLVPKKNDETPTILISPSNLNSNLISLKNTLEEIYGSGNPNLKIFMDALEQAMQKHNSWAKVQDALFSKFVHQELGLPLPDYTVIDIDFDTAIFFLEGGYELMKNNWENLINLANESQHNLNKNYCRVPEFWEAPFYLIPRQNSNSNPYYIRARLLHNNFQSFFGTHPYKKDEILISELSENELLKLLEEEKAGICWRAIPRAFFLAMIFDGHISGGGAQYNKVVGPVFEKLTSSLYWPTAFLSPIDINQGIFQYPSAALRHRKKPPPYQEIARGQITSNLVSILDLFLSLNLDKARDELSRQINTIKENGLKSRIYFSEELSIY